MDRGRIIRRLTPAATGWGLDYPPADAGGYGGELDHPPAHAGGYGVV